MQVETFLSQIQYRITGGSKYLWTSFGPNAWCLESANSFVIIDTKTHMVYSIELSNIDGKSYKWVDPDFINAYIEESREKNCDPWLAYDDIRFIEVTDSSDILSMID